MFLLKTKSELRNLVIIYHNIYFDTIYFDTVNVNILKQNKTYLFRFVINSLFFCFFYLDISVQCVVIWIINIKWLINKQKYTLLYIIKNQSKKCIHYCYFIFISIM